MNETELFTNLENRLTDLASPGIVPGLARLSRLLAHVGNPQAKFSAIHVVGTNGKGSTAATITSILDASSYKTALYTSPHLVSFGERLIIGGAPVSAEQWLRYTDIAEQIVKDDSYFNGNAPTYFELITAIAFMIIDSECVDIAVVEAGLGGRLDATNILKNVALTVVAPIGLDHTEFLGSTIREIASEKFAVMRKDSHAVFAGGESCIDELFLETARKKCSHAHIVNREYKCGSVKVSPQGTDFSLENREFCADFHTNLIGNHQAENAALAIAGVLCLKKHFTNIDLHSICNGVMNTKWPGRLEAISKNPLVILDGAHNPHAMVRLVETLLQIVPNGELNIVLAMMKDKDISSVLALLSKAEPTVICTEIPGMERSMKSDELKKLASASGLNVSESVSDPVKAVNRSIANKGTTVCCGSLYLVGYLKNNIEKLSI